MKSLKELYRVGMGPSSSHTMAPFAAATAFAAAHPDALSYRATLYGSLAKTGKGHLSHKALQNGFAPKMVSVSFDKTTTAIPHPNTLDLVAVYEDCEQSCRIISVGGGAYIASDEKPDASKNIYPHSTFDEIKLYCTQNNMRLCDYVYKFEGETIKEYLHEVYSVMRQAIEAGLSASGVLDGGLNVVRKAKTLFNKRHIDESPQTRENRIVCAYAFAVSEQNAGGGVIVTAPTCGASGVLPAVLRYMQNKRGYTDAEIVNALATAGLVGNIIKTNGSISGAECGCQAEIGSACSMAAAALGELFEMDIEEIEYAAEICIEHHLGLTCDPVDGLVQIPCIERNAVAAMRALNAISLASFLTGSRQISFDNIVTTMKETGMDINQGYRETSESGLAKLYKNKYFVAPSDD